MYKSPTKKQLDTLLRYYQTKDYKNAEKLGITLTNNFPNHELSWKILSISLKELGKILDSLAAIQKIISINPKNPLAYYNLGNTYKELGKLHEAEKNYKKAVSLNPKFLEAQYNLGIVSKENGNLEEAILCYKKAISINPNFVEAYNNMGNIFDNLGKLENAEENYKKAISLNPKFAEAYNNLGNVLEQKGKINEAKAIYEEAILINPRLTNAHRQLSLIKNYDKYDEQFSLLKKLYEDKNTTPQDLCNINFSLTKIYEDLKNYEKAYKHLNEGNKIQKNILNYQIEDDIELFNQIKNKFFKINNISYKIQNKKKNILPIFILGMPRSGTTLIEQIISSHSKVTGLGELPFISTFGTSIIKNKIELTPQTVMKFRETYLEKVKKLSKSNLIITDKMPQNFFYIGLIFKILPEAKIIHVTRNPSAVCWGNYRQWFRSKQLSYSYSITDIIKYYDLYKNLMIFWKKSFKDHIYEIDYEELTINQEKVTKKLIEYLNLSWEYECLKPQDNPRSVATASNIQIRKKIFKGSSQKWKNYEPYLNGVLDHF